MPRPRESLRILKKYVGLNGGVTIEEASDYGKSEGLWFGPGKSIGSVLIRGTSRGKFVYDKISGEFKLPKS